MIPPTNKIIVSTHARDRFLQRFRLYFTPQLKRWMYDNVIVGQIAGGYECTRWKSVPFYRNKVESEYGPTIVIARKPCYYICHPKDDKLVVYTVVPRWYCEP